MNSVTTSHKVQNEIPTEGAELAALVDLVYVQDREPGYTRRRNGRGFAYYDQQGRLLRSAEFRQRIAALAIPPAWTDVWICTDALGHIQATGRDERGRKQYIYHPDWAQVRDQAKFNRLLAFAEALPALRTQIDQDLQSRTLSYNKVAALVVHLLDKTRIRIGNPEYMRQNESFGLTTLQDQHVEIAGSQLTFVFRGKSGKEHTVELRDRRLARLVKQCQEVPGQELFQYRDEGGVWRPLRSTEVNCYLRTVTGQPFSAKDFRTWGGTLVTAVALSAVESATSERERKKHITQAIKQAAKTLGNTVTVCRQYYIHPAVLTAFTNGTLFTTMAQAMNGELVQSGLSREEAGVLALLRAHAC
jgi:DNA topoisomerase-1